MISGVTIPLFILIINKPNNLLFIYLFIVLHDHAV